MTAIWQNDGTGWRLLVPTGFPDERTLHDLVAETPQILPLAGDLRLVVVGNEVSLGNGYADLLAVEPSGRLVVIEIKLGHKAERMYPPIYRFYPKPAAISSSVASKVGCGRSSPPSK